MSRLARLIAIPVLCLLVAAPPVLADPVSPFTGAWTNVDTDGSTQYLSISGGTTMQLTWTDLGGAICDRAGAPTAVLNGQLTATVAGTTLTATWVRAHCGSEALDDLVGTTYAWTYDSQDGTLRDEFFNIWTRR